MSELDDIKAGDTVVIREWRKPDQLAVVERLTPTTIIVHGTAYSKETGRNRGRSSSPYRTSVHPCGMDDLLADRRRQALDALVRLIDPVSRERRRISHERLLTLPVEKLEQALALLAPEPEDAES